MWTSYMSGRDLQLQGEDVGPQLYSGTALAIVDQTASREQNKGDGKQVQLQCDHEGTPSHQRVQAL